ncbi:hypothetical protein LTR24_010605 [Lithohypha guttulata]|uniref:Cytochrome P450 n=1 Tax=Lithohypha guttulata TaxID=1690604 RepID=A0ABR0JTE3_9EURO|nr:hypothetical protein LTR24_010605 [Lithohypha guttulata]
MLHNILNITAAKSYVPYQDLENKQMLLGILTEPGEFVNHIRRYTNFLTTQMVLGFRTTSIHDPKLQQLFDGFEKFCEASSAGTAALVDFYPLLRSLPDLFLPLRSHAKKLHEKERELYIGHWLDVKKRIKDGTAKKPCFCVDLVAAQDQEGFSDALAGYIAGSFLEAGSDTTAATLVGFVQAMILYPDAQQRAQKEIDMVVGSGRLPTMEDETNLQFTRACVKESLRWMPTSILGVPHAVTQDDEYMGYTIPKGATVINNVWAIHHDPNRYENPYKFDPNRFIHDLQIAGEAAKNSDASKRDRYVFGAGRRVCQGLHIAERSLFLAMSRMLWAFNFKAPLDASGQKVLPDASKLTQGLFVMPERFEAVITPRSEKRAAMVQHEWEECRTLLDQNLQWKQVPDGMKFSVYQHTQDNTVDVQ